MSDIAVVGAGVMGSALCWPLVDNGHRVRLVGTHLDGEIIRSCLQHGYHPKLRRYLPPGVTPYYVEDLPSALEGVDVVVSGVNSLGVHWVGRSLAPLLRPGSTIIAVTKGLEATEEGDLQLLPDVLADEFPAPLRDRIAFAAIGGPCIAGELAGRRPTCVVFTSRRRDALERLRAIFRTSYYHIWLSTDVVGVEVCAALKNAYTLAVGLAAGMLERRGGADEAGACMHNAAAAIFAQSAVEMRHVVSALGGSPDKVASLPGVGDQYVTCAGGRTVRLGRLLGRGMTFTQAREEMAGETIESAYVIMQLAKALPKLEQRGVLTSQELPLLRLLCRIITEEAPVELEFDAFFGGDGLDCR